MESRITDGHHATVTTVSDQSPKPLLEGNDGRRDLVTRKRVLARDLQPVQPSAGDGIVGRGEGELVDDHRRARLTHDIDPFPKCTGREENGACFFPKTLEKDLLRRFSLDETRKREVQTYLGVNARHVRVRGEEHEGVPLGQSDDAQDERRGRFDKSGLSRLRMILRHEKDGLTRVIKG